jgi:hypothetical protein
MWNTFMCKMKINNQTETDIMPPPFVAHWVAITDERVSVMGGGGGVQLQQRHTEKCLQYLRGKNIR